MVTIWLPFGLDHCGTAKTPSVKGLRRTFIRRPGPHQLRRHLSARRRYRSCLGTTRRHQRCADLTLSRSFQDARLTAPMRPAALFQTCQAVIIFFRLRYFALRSSIAGHVGRELFVRLVSGLRVSSSVISSTTTSSFRLAGICSSCGIGRRALHRQRAVLRVRLRRLAQLPDQAADLFLRPLFRSSASRLCRVAEDVPAGTSVSAWGASTPCVALLGGVRIRGRVGLDWSSKRLLGLRFRQQHWHRHQPQICAAYRVFTVRPQLWAAAAAASSACRKLGRQQQPELLRPLVQRLGQQSCGFGLSSGLGFSAAFGLQLARKRPPCVSGGCSSAAC